MTTHLEVEARGMKSNGTSEKVALDAATQCFSVDLDLLICFFSVALGWSPLLRSELLHTFSSSRKGLRAVLEELRSVSRRSLLLCSYISGRSRPQCSYFFSVARALLKAPVLSGSAPVGCAMKVCISYVSSALTDIGVIYISPTNHKQCDLVWLYLSSQT